MAPGCAAAASASARMRSLYSAVKVRRLALATTSGFGRGRAGGWGAPVWPAATLRAASLRSASLRSATGQTVGEAEEIPLFFTLIPVLALLSNYDQEHCLINVGTEGKIEDIYGQARRVWLMDRGIPTEEVLAEMRTCGREMFYLVGTPRGRVAKYEKQWLDLPWRKVRDSVEVKLFS